MDIAQAQLFHIALNERDIVYTPDDVARDVVAFFNPSGKILEPCCGKGVFLQYLPPDTEWCEIERGRDFFAEHRHFDWIIGNTPFSNIEEWIHHSLEISENAVLVFRIQSLFMSYYRLARIYKIGGIKTIYMIGTASSIGWEGGAPIAAVHFQRGYTGGIDVRFRVVR